MEWERMAMDTMGAQISICLKHFKKSFKIRMQIEWIETRVSNFISFISKYLFYMVVDLSILWLLAGSCP